MFAIVFLATRTIPKTVGTPSWALPKQGNITEWDKTVSNIQIQHPDKTGVVLLSDGLDAFAVRVLAARAAGRSLDLQYYIWKDDLIGKLLSIEIWHAAERGVRVRLLLDDMNANAIDKKMLALDEHQNIEVRLYNPFRNRNGALRFLEMVLRALRINHRMHNKAWIADGQAAIVGGRNIGEKYFDAATSRNFHDLDLFLVGPKVSQAEGIFDTFWNDAAVVPIKHLKRQQPNALENLIASAQERSNSDKAQEYLQRVQNSNSVQSFIQRQIQPFWIKNIQIVSDPPQKWKRADKNKWLVHKLSSVITGAEHQAALISPYFVPGKHGLKILSSLNHKGVDVGIITNSLAANDVPAVHSGYKRYRAPLVNEGIQLYELKAQGKSERAGVFGSKGASLHTKAFVIDGTKGFVGSFNLDPRSIALNTEMGVMFEDEALGQAILNEYEHLARPQLSYKLASSKQGKVVWIDGLTNPVTVLTKEPDASLGRRILVEALRLLPIESHL